MKLVYLMFLMDVVCSWVVMCIFVLLWVRVVVSVMRIVVL